MPPELDEDLVIEIPDDTVKLPGAEADAAPAAKPAAAREEKPDPAAERGWRASKIARDPEHKGDADRLKELQRERDEAARRAEENEARARAMEEAARTASAEAAEASQRAALREQQAMAAHYRRLEADKAQLDQAISAAQMQAQAAEAALERAAEMGDAKAQAQAQRALARAESDLAQLENGRHAAEREIESTRSVFEDHMRRQQAQQEAKAKEPVRPEPRQPQQPAQPQTVDGWIDTAARQALGDQGAAFLKANKHLVEDQKLNKRFLRFADYYAEKHGQSALKSDDFLDAVAAEFDLAPAEEIEEKPKAPPRRTASAAPVHRSTGHFSSRNLNASTVKLPPALAQHVKSMGLDPAKYALETVNLIKNGKLPKNYLDPDYDHGV